MAAPAYVGPGTADIQLTTNTTAYAAWHASTAENHTGILVVECANDADYTVSGNTLNGAGWALIGSVGTGTPGDAAATHVAVYWHKVTAAEAAGSPTGLASNDNKPAITKNSGDHVIARLYVYSGAWTGGTPIEADVNESAVATASREITVPQITTTTADTLILCAISIPVTTTVFDTTNFTTTGLTSFGIASRFQSSAGNDGSLTMYRAALAGAGGSYTFTNAEGLDTTAAEQAKVTFALASLEISAPSGGALVLPNYDACFRQNTLLRM